MMFYYMPDSETWARSRWQLKRCWMPRRCVKSGQNIWLKLAYRGSAVWTGPGDPVVEHAWLACDEYIMLKIKGQIN